MQTSLVNHKLRLIKAYHSYSGSIFAYTLPSSAYRLRKRDRPPPLLPATSGNRSTDLSGIAYDIFRHLNEKRKGRAHLTPPPPPHTMDNKKGKREPREQWRTPCGGWVVFAPARSARHVDRIIVWHGARGLAGENCLSIRRG